MKTEESPAYQEWRSASDSLKQAHDRMFQAIEGVINESLSQCKTTGQKIACLHSFIDLYPDYWMNGIKREINNAATSKLRLLSFALIHEETQQ